MMSSCPRESERRGQRLPRLNMAQDTEPPFIPRGGSVGTSPEASTTRSARARGSAPEGPPDAEAGECPPFADVQEPVA